MDALIFKRIGELVNMGAGETLEDYYFKDFFIDIEKNEIMRDKFVAHEAQLAPLDVSAWDFLKQELYRCALKKNKKRAWEPLFDTWNEAVAYGYLKDRGCTDIKFIGRDRGGEQKKTPDLEAQLNGRNLLCDAKKINMSDDEIERRRTGAVKDVDGILHQGFFSKIKSHAIKANEQIASYGGNDQDVCKVVFVSASLDDWLGCHFEKYVGDIEGYLKELSCEPDLDGLNFTVRLETALGAQTVEVWR